MFSLAGLPPLVGFYAKLAVLQALIASGQAVYIGLAVFAVMMSLVGAFYYLRVVKVMYFDEPVTASTVVGAARRAHGADDQRRADPDPRHPARRPHDAVRQGDRGHAGHLRPRPRPHVSQTASVWVVLLVALVAANLPFVNERLLGVVPLARRARSLAVRLARTGAAVLPGRRRRPAVRAPRRADRAAGLGVLRRDGGAVPRAGLPGLHLALPASRHRH